MPMIEAFVPEAALAPDVEARLFQDLADLLVRLEGFGPSSERGARSITVIYLHRPVVFAGAPATLPRYRFVLPVPEGRSTDELSRAVLRGVTEAVARAEQRAFEDVSLRVWVRPDELRDGRWGGRETAQRQQSDMFAQNRFALNVFSALAP